MIFSKAKNLANIGDIKQMAGKRLYERKTEKVQILFDGGEVEGSVALKSNRTFNDARIGKELIPRRWRRKTGKAASLFESFYHAFHGVAVGLREQRNLRIHFLVSPLVALAAFLLGVDLVGWLALIIVMSLVISLELVNTSLEHLVDIAVDGQYRYAARLAKDTAAAAVLVVTFAAVLVGALVFGPHLLALLSSN